jgi:hypothetical protein
MPRHGFDAATRRHAAKSAEEDIGAPRRGSPEKNSLLLPAVQAFTWHYFER